MEEFIFFKKSCFVFESVNVCVYAYICVYIFKDMWVHNSLYIIVSTLLAELCVCACVFLLLVILIVHCFQFFVSRLLLHL